MKSAYNTLLTALLLSFHLCMMVVPGAAYAQASQPVPNQIDLTLDENGDKIPDALASEVETIRAMSEVVQAASADSEQQAAQIALAMAITSFGERLPYTQQTRMLQQRENEISLQLQNAEDPASISVLYAELEQIESQKMADPNYAEVMQALPVLLGLSTAIPPTDSVATQKMYLPLISVGRVGVVMDTTDRQLDKTLFDSQATAASTNAGPNFGALVRGDIMFIRGGSKTRFLYAMNYTHVGAYDGSNWVYESNQDGVKLRPLKEWQTKGTYVGLGYNKRTSSTQDRQALDWAKNKWKTGGQTGYNYWFIDKNTDAKLYCSQLVWKIQKYSNVDVDSNHWQYMLWMTARYWSLFGLGTTAAVYAMVAPDEVALDSDVTIYSTGTN